MTGQATEQIITFTDQNDEWNVVGTHDVPTAIEAIRAEHGDELTPEWFELAGFEWGRFVEVDDIEAAFAIERCPQDHPDALPWISAF